MKLKIVEIKWMDSQHTSGWTYSEDMLKEIDNADLLYTTVGYLFKENKLGVSVVQSYKLPKENKDYSIDACMTIPRRAIMSIKKIR